MNLRVIQERKQSQRRDPELNVTPVMNVFLILIPFLLLTAVFVRIAVLELALPSIARKSETQRTQPPEQLVLNMLTIDEGGFQLKSTGMTFARIPVRNGRYDYKALAEQLKKVKQKYAESEDIIIAPASSIKYETIVQVMDTCRESGFPNISISG